MMSKNLTCVSYAITINPSDGCCEQVEAQVHKYLASLKVKYCYVIEHASQRHMHMGTLFHNKNLATMIRRQLIKHFPERMSTPLAAVYNKQWFKPSDEGTWINYMSKDGDVKFMNDCPQGDELTPLLFDNIPLDERRKHAAWGEMSKLIEQFKEHNLPTATRKDISVGLSNLAYSKQVIRLPDAAKVPGLIFNLHNYANFFEGDLLDSMSDFSTEQNNNRKRKREALESSETKAILFDNKVDFDNIS